MELWDLYDIHHQPTGETMVRGEPVPAGKYHLVIHVCIFNSRGDMLIQHRQSFKPTWSNMWDVTVGGGAVSGENSQLAAHRETLEEIGCDIDFSDIAPAMCITFPDGYDDFYIVERDLEIDTLALQYEEVQAVKWASRDEILSMIDDGSFIPYHHSFIDFLFFRRNHSGSRMYSRGEEVKA